MDREEKFKGDAIQDIINELQMSKGAIYHHFKSKEEILHGVLDRKFLRVSSEINRIILSKKDLTALEKLRMMFMYSINDDESRLMDISIKSKCKDQYFILGNMEEMMNRVVPIIRDIVEMGQIDGSLKSEYPEEIAEVIMMLTNICLSPIIFQRTPEDIVKKIKFLRHMLENMGVPIITEEMMSDLIRRYKELCE
ncbi:TetR/AcrR family transcriptional regulator [Clostridium sp. UBA6640]|uniref:TetR/AcrR family transcriptional regulator n=1 Tax=Clostridium sp. UBA6640 TaxID=1946370 RepID=UPI0025C56CB2|nr:TetR/AcrR family transcriptional regulator [Clostridium sp. UBA6640]